jgi:hypothetical protein
MDPDSGGPKTCGSVGSGSASGCHKYGSRSFHHQAKVVRKTWFLLFCDFFMTFYQCSGSAFGSGSEGSVFWTSRIRIRIRKTEVRMDPDPYQNVTGPLEWFPVLVCFRYFFRHFIKITTSELVCVRIISGVCNGQRWLERHNKCSPAEGNFFVLGYLSQTYKSQTWKLDTGSLSIGVTTFSLVCRRKPHWVRCSGFGRLRNYFAFQIRIRIFTVLTVLSKTGRNFGKNAKK